MAALTFPRRSLDFFVVPNLFFCTYFANDDTVIVLYPCGITYRNLILVHVCEINVPHIYRFPYCLVKVALEITSAMSRMTLVTIYVCVLTGIRTGQYDQIKRWWSYKTQSGIATVLDYTTYCYVLLP